MKILIVIFLLMMLMSTGCQHTPSEDSQEEISIISSQCPDISGTYNNIGKFIEPEAPPESSNITYLVQPCTISEDGKIRTQCILSEMLSNTLDVPIDRLPDTLMVADYLDTTVEISKSDIGYFRVRVYDNGNVKREFYLGKERQPYKCKGGILKTSKGNREGQSTGYRASILAFTLTPGIDDSLVFEVDFRQHGLIYAKHLNLKYRFQKMK